MRTILAQITIALTFCLALVGISSPALAAPEGCDGAYLCFYNSSSGPSDLMVAVTVNITYPDHCYLLPASAQNKTSYIVNQTGSDWYVYHSNNCSGTNSRVYAHSSGKMNAEWNNFIVSYFRP